jgi:HSP20 family protein
MALTRWNPFGSDDDEMTRRRGRRGSREPYNQLQREMNRLFEDFLDQTSMIQQRRGTSSSPSSQTSRQFTPRIDVSEDDESLTISAELPGMTKDDIELYCDNDSVTLQGEKFHEETDENEGYHRTERSYGHFKRRIPFTADVDPDNAKAKFDDGVLTVRFPKSGEAKGKRLEID